VGLKNVRGIRIQVRSFGYLKSLKKY